MGEEKKEENKPTPEDEAYAFTVIIFVLVAFIIVGIIAMVWSFVCLGKSGSSFEKLIGVLIAFFTGPFYFIYYGFNTSYCRDVSSGNVGGKRRKH